MVLHALQPLPQPQVLLPHHLKPLHAPRHRAPNLHHRQPLPGTRVRPHQKRHESNLVLDEFRTRSPALGPEGVRVDEVAGVAHDAARGQGDDDVWGEMNVFVGDAQAVGGRDA